MPKCFVIPSRAPLRTPVGGLGAVQGQPGPSSRRFGVFSMHSVETGSHTQFFKMHLIENKYLHQTV